MADIINPNYNPLLEINTSFKAYLDARTRTYTDHIISAGRLDYAYDGDFAMRSRINTVPGWSKLYKAITSSDIPNRFKRLFRTSDIASSVCYTSVFKAADVCSRRMQVPVPPVLIRKSSVPEIYSLAGEGLESCIVLSSSIAEMCGPNELCYLIGCELGRLQNRHAAYNYAFTYPGIKRGGNHDDRSRDDPLSENALLSYNLNRWLCAADITADRAGIICLEKPSDFAEVFASIRRKSIPDSFGDFNTEPDLHDILKRYETFHTTPIRSLEFSEDLPQDERRIFAGLEFTACEILYSWRPDLDSSEFHIATGQTLEIRCEALMGMDADHISD